MICLSLSSGEYPYHYSPKFKISFDWNWLKNVERVKWLARKLPWNIRELSNSMAGAVHERERRKKVHFVVNNAFIVK